MITIVEEMTIPIVEEMMKMTIVVDDETMMTEKEDIEMIVVIDEIMIEEMIMIETKRGDHM